MLKVSEIPTEDRGMMSVLDAFLLTAVHLKVSDPNDQLCCVFVRATMSRLFGEVEVAKAPLSLWNLWPSEKDPWGPVTAALRSGCAKAPPVPGQPVPGAWHIVQGWQGTPFGAGVAGHTFLWYQGPEGTGIRLDSADKRSPDGGFVDTIEDGPSATTTTWAAIRARYSGGVALGVLSKR